MTESVAKAERLGLAKVDCALPYSQKLGVFGVLLLVGLAVRFPFFFRAVIDWDESTFILMGQSILDGHLPYTRLWDNKPPLAFAFFAMVIAVFGKNLVVIRVVGTLCVVMTSFLVYLTAQRVWNKRIGIIAAVLSILAASLLQSGQATMSEHVALLPLVGAMYLLICRELSVRTLFLVGALMATATLVRLNLGYVVVVMGLYVVAVSAPRSAVTAAKYAAAYAGGGMSVVAITWTPYLFSGQPDLWWASVIMSPLSYAESQYSMIHNLIAQMLHAFGAYGRHKIKVPWLNALVWMGAAGGFFVVLRRLQHVSRIERRGIALLVLFTVSTGLGIVRSGTPTEHYMIQLVPFSAMFAGILLEQLPRRVRLSLFVLTGVATAVSLAPVFAEYRTIASRLMAKEELQQGAEYEIAAYLKRENSFGCDVYLLSDHIVYWFIGCYPPTRITTHPSNIGKLFLLRTVIGKEASTEEELSKVFGKKPEFVVTKGFIWYLPEGPTRKLDGILDDEYVLVKEIKGRKIFQRKSSYLW